MYINFLRHKTIPYPSGSALEFRNNVLYVVGDDINYVLCLDNDWNEINRIVLFEFDGDRIPKPDKPDLECATIIADVLYLMGSGSKSPQRDVAFIVDLFTGKIKKINTAAFYAIFRDRKLVQEMNIEGFSVCKDQLLFFNRANTTQGNQLIITDTKIIEKQLPNKFKIIPINIAPLENIPLGISGACYDAIQDRLFLTASAEDTSNAYDDGKIIGSVLAIVDNAYEQLTKPTLDIHPLIYLDKVHSAFTEQKIESICITESKNNFYKCTLVADNDDGKSQLFEIEILI